MKTSVGFWAVAATLLVGLMGSQLPTPLYPAYETEFDLNPLALTVVFASYVATLIPALLVFGPFSDARGRRETLYIGLGFLAAGSLLFTVASGLLPLLVARMVQGLGVGAISAAATAALSEHEPQGDHRRAALISAVAVAGGAAMGPVFTGTLAAWAPEPHVLAYALHLVLVVGCGLALRQVHETPRRGSWRVRAPSVPRQIVGLFVQSSAIAFLLWAVTALFLSLVPSLMTAQLATSNPLLLGVPGGLLFGASAVTQLLARRVSSTAAQLLCLVLMLVALAGLLAGAGTTSVALVIIASIAAGCGHGLGFMATMRRVNQAAPTSQRGAVIAAYLTISYLGVGLPTVGVGALATVQPLLTAIAEFSGIIGIACAVLLVSVLRTTRRQASLAVTSVGTSRP